ncbi:MAG: hypothetical protein KME15_11415 [Drouetiella hepatica Uher 2000/2452]|jgi:nitrous oxide reductase accessory protein NosL|uniref:Uncharacterized protein n=1 Tax=Drouetiella hepatica Uher 2000/2452 TaxID=904376 RepID=A0A951QB89_9CYAN|nr:hypothetical protein [Drouetiella hepatica Uher 2000/2452]
MLSDSSSQNSALPIPIFTQKAVKRCHIMLPDTPEPTSAICYNGQYYAYVKFFSTVEVARHKATLMAQRGSTVLLTRIPKGLVLWVLETDAQSVTKLPPLKKL